MSQPCMNDGVMMSRHWMPASHAKHLRLKWFYLSSTVVSGYPFFFLFYLYLFVSIFGLHRPFFSLSYINRKDI